MGAQSMDVLSSTGKEAAGGHLRERGYFFFYPVSNTARPMQGPDLALLSQCRPLYQPSPT